MYFNLFDNFKNFFHKTDSNCMFCKYFNNSLIFSQNGLIKICNKDDSSIDEKFVIKRNFNGINFDVNELKDILVTKKSDIMKNYDFKSCKDCCNCAEKTLTNDNIIKNIIFSHWKCCFLNCTYCSRSKSDDISEIEHYDVFPVIEKLIDGNLLTKDTKVIFECGDAALHPEFDKILYFFINYEMKNIEIYTSAQRYCYSIAEALDKKILNLNIALDSSNSYIYERVKGINKFDITMENIKRYLVYDTYKKPSINIIYTLAEGLNDNKQEVLNWFLLLKGMGVRKLSVDIDLNWYNRIINTVPDYLKDLLLFIKKLSEINNFNIEFTPKTAFIYNKILKREN